MWYSHRTNPLTTLRHYSCISGTLILHMNICFTEHCYCISLWTYPLSHRYYYFNHISPLHRYYYTWHHWCLLHVSLIHEYTNSLDTVIIVTWMLCTQLIMFVYHCYMYSLAYMHVLFLYSCHMNHRSYYMYYCCMYIHVFLLHDYFPLLILLFLLLDIWAVDMCCMESHISCFLFSVILFYAINRAHILLSYYMYYTV